MWRRILVCAVALLGAALGGAARASVIYGPMEDYRGSVENPGGSNLTIIINTKFWKIRDRIEINVPPFLSLRPLAGVAYVESATPDLAAGNLTITTIYGQDANPGGALQLTGFTPGAPEVTIQTPETIIGDSGTEYHASSSQTLTLSQLAQTYSTFDLSPFTGSSSSLVYAFTTVVPGSDVTVPEPAAVGLIGCVAVAACLRRRRA